MEKNLNFISTQTVEQFKREQGVDRLDVKQNPRTGKLFFSFGAATGAVASAGIPKRPMVSKVQGTPSEQNPTGVFYLLHEEGNGGAPVMASF